MIPRARSGKSGAMDVDFQELLRRFGIGGALRSAAPLGEGRMHDTFVSVVEADGGAARFVFQRLNRHVFPDLDAVMANVVRVLDHVGGKPGARRVPELVRAADGAPLVTDDDGAAWRTWRYVEGATTHRRVRSLDHAREAARAFGLFLRDLADLPGPRLAEPVPGFHDTPAYLARLPEDAPERDRIRRLSEGADAVAAGMAAGEIPERPVHNDTKLDNVLIDDETERAVCVLDLDTVMPGSAVTDFGDLVRSAANPGTEDGPVDGPVAPRMDVLGAVTEGWIGAVGDLLTRREVELLPAAGRLIALELASRFLADHLAGDVYFRVAEPGQNLTRARTQLALAEGLAAKEGEIRTIVSDFA